MVKWFHYELDPPSAAFDAFAAARQSFDSVRGAAAPALYAAPPSFTAVDAKPASMNADIAQPVPVKVENLGDAPLSITGVTVQATAPETASNQDFTVTSETCTSGPLAPGTPATATAPAVKGGSCTVFVRFNPRRAVTTSIARLQFTSNADAALNRVALVARSGASIAVQSPVGGSVDSVLSLSIPGQAAFAPFVPGTARDYTATLLADVVSTMPDATLSVVDPTTNATGHLVNGTRALQQALRIRATNTANPNTTYQPLSEAGAPLALLTWNGPTAGERVTLGFQQSIAATENLLRGTYAKTLTYTLASTTP